MTQQLAIVADALRALGIISVAIVALSAHLRVMSPKVLDDAIARRMARERAYAIVGIVLVALSFIINSYAILKS